MNSFAPNINDSLQEILDKRKEEFLYRILQLNKGMIDFCSNDYLSFARSESIRQQVQRYAEECAPLSGATGSRSISGNSSYAEDLERCIASYHHAEAALLFNSGYDANVGMFSCIAKKEDILICDELIHASIIDGCRLSYARRFKFAHNDPRDLKKKLKQANLDRAPGSSIFVAVESIYSMDGDAAPLPEIATLCLDYNANLIVDEAHATGVFGP
ncbi:MAG TPA: pyridoxal phosphate-dependent aminotransferase family protein, partial [Chitinophagaceae bacterium]|nr:pyridoxal phosphate-dependent aminotransferase family protein [Chitinophagaceae bacterium]